MWQLQIDKLKLIQICLVSALVCLMTACIGEPDYGEEPDLTRLNDTPVGDCTEYTQSEIYRGRGTTVIVYPESDWINAIENATPGTEILFEDGDYFFDQYAVRVRSDLTIRGLNNDAARVRIRGMGYREPSEGFMILGNDVTIANLSIADIRDHAVSVKPESGALQGLRLYNLDIRDIGTQHIKVSPGQARDGLIACSRIGYSAGSAVGDYNGAIDLHQTVNWVVRDNYIYNINGDGSGCRVDIECGQHHTAPAILAWNDAQGTRIIGNTIVDSYRNIALGIGTRHTGGEILHNTIRQTAPGDAGIELFGATDLVVEFNTVQLAGRYPGTVEFRQSNNLTITNNWLSRKPWNRGGNSSIVLSGNAYRIPP